MLDAEKPDLVIHTGDIIYGNPAAKSARELFQPIVDRNIPFAVALGNHDSDFELTRNEIFDVIRDIPGNINTPVREGLYGCSNDVISLSSSKGVERVFYLFDSGSYINYRDEKGYDYIRHSQIGWYRDHSRAFAEANGGKPVPSVAFFHIAVREFTDGMKDESRDIVGTSCEKPCPSNYNSGLVANFKEMDDVEAVVCGHDHDNDYVMLYQNMFYIFGRFSGCDTVYNRVGPSGARIFEFTEGKEGFRTYIRKYGSNPEQDLDLRRGMKHLLGDIKKF
jgi:3',5'-cyclic AMP phosphodiesterase CpdA